MRIFTNPDQSGHNPRDEFYRGQRVPCFENPTRADHVLQALSAAGGAVEAPTHDSAAALAQVHAPRYLAFLQDAWRQWLALAKISSSRGFPVSAEAMISPTNSATWK